MQRSELEIIELVERMAPQGYQLDDIMKQVRMRLNQDILRLTTVQCFLGLVNATVADAIYSQQRNTRKAA